MSEYYKQIRRIVLKQFKHFGVFERIQLCSYGVLAVISLFMIILLVLGINYSYTEMGNFYLFIFLAAMGIFFWKVAYLNKKQYYNKRKEAVDFIINGLNIDEDIINMLIKEINEYIKKVQTISTWIIGITVTFLVLFITISANYIQKIIDIIVKLFSDEELKNFVLDSNIFKQENIFTMLQMILILLIIVISSIVLCYCAFGIVAFDKKQMLYFLYDVRYQLCMTEEQQKSLNEEMQKITLLGMVKRDR